MIKRIHAGAGGFATVIIATFWLSSATSELALAPAAVARVKLAILYAIPMLIAAMAVAGITGAVLARTRKGPLVQRKKLRMPIVALNGLVILVPCAWILNAKAATGQFDAPFYGIQALELLAGAVNLLLLGLNIRDGLRLTGKIAAPTHS